jgi:hypothetical protein
VAHIQDIKILSTDFVTNKASSPRHVLDWKYRLFTVLPAISSFLFSHVTDKLYDVTALVHRAQNCTRPTCEIQKAIYINKAVCSSKGGQHLHANAHYILDYTTGN